MGNFKLFVIIGSLIRISIQIQSSLLYNIFHFKKKKISILAPQFCRFLLLNLSPPATTTITAGSTYSTQENLKSSAKHVPFTETEKLHEQQCRWFSSSLCSKPKFQNPQNNPRRSGSSKASGRSCFFRFWRPYVCFSACRGWLHFS